MTSPVDAKRCLIVGNWKMNGTLEQAESFARRAVPALAGRQAGRELVICPPATLLTDLSVLFIGCPIALGAQDCHAAVGGAFTGDISAVQLADCGAEYIIVGHSERRQSYGESDVLVAAKARAAVEAGLVAIICVGESATERGEGRTLDVVGHQLAGSVPSGFPAASLVIAYEPIWAIGADATPSEADIAIVHRHIKATLAELHSAAFLPRVLYGGSVKPSNAAAILAIDGVDGVLVGGASLDPDDFLSIAGVQV